MSMGVGIVEGWNYDVFQNYDFKYLIVDGIIRRRIWDVIGVGEVFRIDVKIGFQNLYRRRKFGL